MTDASGQSESSGFSKRGRQSRPVLEILPTRACWVATAGVGAQVPATGRGRDGGSSKLYGCGAIVVVLSFPVRHRRERVRREMRPVLELGGRSGEEPAHRRGPCCCCCRSPAGLAGSTHSGSSCRRGATGRLPTSSWTRARGSARERWDLGEKGAALCSCLQVSRRGIDLIQQTGGPTHRYLISPGPVIFFPLIPIHIRPLSSP